MSKKKGKLSKVELFYIDNNADKSVADLAKDLNRTESSIEKHIHADTGHLDNVQDDKSNIGDLMGHKEDRGVTVMTPAASELADETRTSRIGISKKHQDAIHVINPDKK